MSTSGGAGGVSLAVANNWTGVQNFVNGLTSTGAANLPTLTTQALFSRVTRKTISYSVNFSDEILLCDASGGAFTISVPVVQAVQGRRLTIKKTDSSANAVSVSTLTGAIDSGGTIVMATQNEAVSITFDGTNWFVVNQVATIIL